MLVQVSGFRWFLQPPLNHQLGVLMRARENRSSRVMLRYWLRRAVIILLEPQKTLVLSIVMIYYHDPYNRDPYYNYNGWFNRDPYNDLL